MKKNRIIWTCVAVIIFGNASAQSATMGGVVVSEKTGDPLPFTLLEVLKEKICSRDTIFLPQSTLSTDENGLFNLTDLEAGTYKIAVLSSKQYLPEAYDNVSPYALSEITTITLEEDEVKNDIYFELTERPFYFDNVRWEPWDFMHSGGLGKAIVTVMNTTAREKEMRFWLTFELKREDRNRFDDATSLVPGGISRELHTLAPGSNTIELEVVLPEGIGEHAHLEYTIVGGLNRWHPLLPAWYSVPKGNYFMYPVCSPTIENPATNGNTSLYSRMLTP